MIKTTNPLLLELVVLASYHEELTDSTLHTTVLALARLSNTQVEGVVPAMLIHFSGQKAVSLDHHQRVGGLHREQEVVVVVFPVMMQAKGRTQSRDINTQF